MIYRAPNRIEDGSRSRVSVAFVPGQWRSIDGRVVSREEIMMTLASVQNVLIRLQYIDSVQREVELLHIEMDSATSDDQGLGSASLVEECRCPAGYSGNFWRKYSVFMCILNCLHVRILGMSCENCAPGYTRQESGAWLGRCVSVFYLNTKKYYSTDCSH